MLRNIFWMGSSTTVRLGSSLLLFVLIARALGPEEFGHYMFWYTTTLLCSVIANYGLGHMLLKEIAQHPDDAANIVGQALSLRLILTAIILICAAIIAWLVDRPGLLFVFLFIHFNDILSETFYCAYRALGFYARETQLATTAAIAQLTLVALAVYTHQSTEVIALSHLTGRLVQLALILPTAGRTVGAFQLHSPITAFKLAICNKAYFFDGILVNTFGNIDNIVLRLYVGIDTIGIYQSGMRIFQGGLNAIPILSNVFLPIMARQALHSEKKTRAALALQITFLVFGAIFGLVLAYFSTLIIKLFGENYSSLSALLPFFGLLFFIRFFAAGWGVILIAENQQAYRAISTAIHLMFTLTLGSYLTYEFHAKGWLITLILANILLGVLYMVRAIREGYAASARISVSAVVVVGLLFIPKIY
jgi:O-antigen/teichoic acid export membrane protein